MNHPIHKRCLKKQHKKCTPGVVENKRASMKLLPIKEPTSTEPEFHSWRQRLRPTATTTPPTFTRKLSERSKTTPPNPAPTPIASATNTPMSTTVITADTLEKLLEESNPVPPTVTPNTSALNTPLTTTVINPSHIEHLLDHAQAMSSAHTTTTNTETTTTPATSEANTPMSTHNILNPTSLEKTPVSSTTNTPQSTIVTTSYDADQLIEESSIQENQHNNEHSPSKESIVNTVRLEQTEEESPSVQDENVKSDTEQDKNSNKESLSTNENIILDTRKSASASSSSSERDSDIKDTKEKDYSIVEKKSVSSESSFHSTQEHDLSTLKERVRDIDHENLNIPEKSVSAPNSSSDYSQSYNSSLSEIRYKLPQTNESVEQTKTSEDTSSKAKSEESSLSQAKNMMRASVLKQQMARHDNLKQDRRKTVQQTGITPATSNSLQDVIPIPQSGSSGNSSSNSSIPATSKSESDIETTRPKSFSFSSMISSFSLSSEQGSGRVSKTKKGYVKDFYVSIARGHHKEVKKNILKLVNKSSSRNALFQDTDEYGQTILHLVAEYFPELIKVIVEKKMDINKADNKGMSPLSAAAARGDQNVFEELLSLGAKPDSTVFHYVCGHFCSNKCESIIKNLISMGIDVNMPATNSKNGDRPLHAAIRNTKESTEDHLVGSVLIIEILLKYGAKVNLPNSRGDTPLHWTVYTDKSRVAKLLLIAGADIKAKGAEGCTALDLALKKPNSSICQCLRRASEIIQILKTVEFHTEEPYEYVLKKFIEEEIGETSFKGLTSDLLSRMGIKNAATIASLLNAQERLKRGEVASNIATSPTISGTESVGSQRKNTIGEYSPVQVNPGTQLSVEDWVSMLPNGLQAAKKLMNTNDSVQELEILVAKKRLDSRLEQAKLKRKILSHASDTDIINYGYFAVGDQLFDSVDSSSEIRGAVSNWLLKNKEAKFNTLNSLSFYVSDSWEDYCKSVESKQSLLDPIQLIAISELYGVKIVVISSIIGNSFIVTLFPSTLKTSRTLLLFHSFELTFGALEQQLEDPLFLDWDDFMIEFKDIKLVKAIGSGSTADIYEALWRGAKVAAKKVTLNTLSKEDIRSLMGEISLLKRLRHPNIISFMASCIYDNELYILTEYMSQGNLKNLLRTTDLDFHLKLNIALDIANGMNYLHNLRPPIIHRDLKTSNILVDKSLNVKIADFGVAKIIDNDVFLRTYCSTPSWSSPEMLNAEPYNEKVDVYGYALILWSLITRKQPFEEFSEQQVILGVSQGNLRPTIPENCLPGISKLIQECWARNPAERPNFDQILVSIKDIMDKQNIKSINDIEMPLIPRNRSLTLEDLRGKAYSSPSPRGTINFNSIEGQQYWMIDYSELTYSTSDLIGSGKSANVYRGVFREQRVAIKVLKEVPEDGSFEKELQVLSRIRTPYLVFFYGACLKPKCCIVTEHMEKGTLFDLMNANRTNVGWKDVIKYSKEIANGIWYLHSWKPPCVHRDIKSSNLLLDKENSIKICDLGLARFTTKSNDLTLRKCKGTPVYMAPEAYFSALEVNEEERSKEGSELKNVIDNIKEREYKGWSTKSDVFSFAIVLWELCTRAFYGEYRTPYYSDNKALKYDAAILIQVARKGLRPIIRKDIPVPFKNLIAKCWAQEPGSRPDFDQIIEELKEIELDYNKNEKIWEKCYIQHVIK